MAYNRDFPMIWLGTQSPYLPCNRHVTARLSSHNDMPGSPRSGCYLLPPTMGTEIAITCHYVVITRHVPTRRLVSAPRPPTAAKFAQGFQRVDVEHVDDKPRWYHRGGGCAFERLLRAGEGLGLLGDACGARISACGSGRYRPGL